MLSSQPTPQSESKLNLIINEAKKFMQSLCRSSFKSNYTNKYGFVYTANWDTISISLMMACIWEVARNATVALSFNSDGLVSFIKINHGN